MRIGALFSLALLTALPSTGFYALATDGSGQQEPRQQLSKPAAAEAHSEVHLTDAQRQHLQLRVARAGRGRAEALTRLPASIAFDADRVAKIGPRMRAKVIRVIKDLGEKVAVGEAVALMDSVALGKAKARYLTTRARLETERANYVREKKLAAQKITSEATLLEAKARYGEAQAALNAATEELRLHGLSRKAIQAIAAGGKTPLSRHMLTSPIAGVVQQRGLTPGQTIGADETPIHVVDTREMWVMIEAYERNIPMLAVGQSARITLRALPERRFEGRIDWISRALDSDSRTLRVRAVLDNPDGQLRAGMFGTAAIRTRGIGQAALVPIDAVQTVNGRPAVFVPGEEVGAFRAVSVVLGEESDGRVEVVSGIQPGDRVVVAGAFDLKSAMTASRRSAAHGH
ncbi:efflux RND transporter periplasmic adaptor subunit [Nitrococcus mobilis]|uniref:Secretion protein HlyD n=1 Tax=Nitrococcus mobilis Nb-231 TaxID=314278 RepID=A4BRR1_9GAMM|nr:efflux RND transporter periplasmic adaptor subunit [Nitrococcus mobilis]EAR21632.1 Secretion protein HlyD [Nitrococcus mobilis Nb-231]